MIELANAPKPKPKELEQQKADFTAEGAPPHGPGPAGPADKPQPEKSELANTSSSPENGHQGHPEPS